MLIAGLLRQPLTAVTREPLVHRREREHVTDRWDQVTHFKHAYYLLQLEVYGRSHLHQRWTRSTHCACAKTIFGVLLRHSTSAFYFGILRHSSAFFGTLCSTCGLQPYTVNPDLFILSVVHIFFLQYQVNNETIMSIIKYKQRKIQNKINILK